MACNAPKIVCHPERLKKIEDFCKESKDLRTDSSASVPQMRRSFDSLRSLRMTNFEAVAKPLILQQPLYECRIFIRDSGVSQLSRFVTYWP